MKKKTLKKTTQKQKKDIRIIAGKKDEAIDFSDAAPVLDWSGATIGKFYRPEKTPRRTLAECIALLPKDSTAVIDADFAKDVAAAIENHREPLEPLSVPEDSE